MIKAMGRWVAKGIPQQPLFLMQANAYYDDQCIGVTEKTIKEELVDFDREQRARYKSAGGNLSFISKWISELEHRLDEAASDKTKAQIFSPTLNWVDEVGLISELREFEKRADKDLQSLQKITTSNLTFRGSMRLQVKA